jgi:hypothetical protein
VRNKTGISQFGVDANNSRHLRDIGWKPRVSSFRIISRFLKIISLRENIKVLI